jgi:hypothetical protein
MTKPWYLPAAAAVIVVGAACTEQNLAQAKGGGRVTLALTTRPVPEAALTGTGGAGARVIAQGDSTVVIRGADTLIVRDVAAVLREIKIERVDGGCSSRRTKDACGEFEVGPVLVPFPLGNGSAPTLTINAPAAAYDELSFEVHEPDKDDDASFIAAHPAFANASIRVLGTFSRRGMRTDFAYLTDLDEEIEVDLVPLVQVAAGGDVTLTLRLDVSTWFLTRSGMSIVDPASANEDMPNEDLVNDNIERSIEVFEDGNRDGMADRIRGG